jgi:oligopeptide/dipeptide ABC transporter ATP-binding protein
MASIPSLDLDKETLYSIPGTVPNAAEFPPGCRFAARCERVCKDCTETDIPLEEKAPGHLVRCIRVSAAGAT